MARKVMGFAALALVVLLVVPLAFVYAVLSASQPALEGDVIAAGLGSPVRIERDSLGIPTITARTRADLAYGTGFVHAQDRFFQMDLSRRLAAGELSELFGRLALEQDRRARLFRFRSLARQVLEQATPEQREIVEAYARGVNAGLSALRARPWEYFILQATPADWQPEDVVLVSYAMWWDLQYDSLRTDQLKRAINSKLRGPECANGWACALEFFYPRGTSWDAPNGAADAASSSQIRIPSVDELNVRGIEEHTDEDELPVEPPVLVPRSTMLGSNGWAVAGSLTQGGGALVANDMHLRLRIPATWYRARMQVRAEGSDVPTLDLNGLTLPGAPVLVAGSNGHIAWGFTNAYGDWSDVTHVPCEAVSDEEMLTPQGPVALTTEHERIQVKNEKTHALLPVRTGPDGVLFEAGEARDGCWFARWLAMIPEATNLDIMSLEQATSVAEALDLAPAIGIPHQNFMVGDREGHIAWSILGRIPDTQDPLQRFTGEAPWTTAANHPRLLNPPSGRVWTANGRPIDDPVAESYIGSDEAPLGAQYDLSARSRQIRDGLFALEHPATPADMLAIQLDDRAVFLTRWRDLLLEVLDEAAVRDHPMRAQFRQLAESWKGRAAPDDVGYRLVRAWRDQTEDAAWLMLLEPLNLPLDGASVPSQFEGALWELVTQQPMHLLAARYENWRAFLLQQVDATIRSLTEPQDGKPAPCPDLARCTWGSRVPVHVDHPLAGALPFVSRYLNMPARQLVGDRDMPRVQGGTFGASERFAVVPGRESEGYLHIAGGQSGHPLSPYYRAGFGEWAEGKPLPFLPGATEHALTLLPAAAGP